VGKTEKRMYAEHYITENKNIESGNVCRSYHFWSVRSVLLRS